MEAPRDIFSEDGEARKVAALNLLLDADPAQIFGTLRLGV